MDAGAVQTDEDAQLVRGPVGICGARGREPGGELGEETRAGRGEGARERPRWTPGAMPVLGEPPLGAPTSGELRVQRGNRSPPAAGAREGSWKELGERREAGAPGAGAQRERGPGGRRGSCRGGGGLAG